MNHVRIHRHVLRLVLLTAVIAGLTMIFSLTALAADHSHTIDGKDVTYTAVSTQTDLANLFKNGGYGYLTTDINVSGSLQLTVENSDVNLCMNGHSIIYTESSSSAEPASVKYEQWFRPFIIVKGDGDLTITDCSTDDTNGISWTVNPYACDHPLILTNSSTASVTVKNCNLTMNYDTYQSNLEAIYAYNLKSLSLDNVDISISNNDDIYAVYLNELAEPASIHNCSILINDTNPYGSSFTFNCINNKSNQKVNITGADGHFSITLKNSRSSGTKLFAGSNYCISGGLFSESFSNSFLADGVVVTANPDGTYTVAHSHDNIVFNKTLDSTFTGGALDSGSYVLAGDITLTEPITIASGAEVNLCLDGYTINANKNRAFYNSGTLNLCDCNSTKQTHNFKGSLSGSWTLTDNDSTTSYEDLTSRPGTSQIIQVQGGVITGGYSNNGGGIFLNGKAALTMKNIHLIGNSSSGSGSAVYLNNSAAVTLEDCTIAGNYSGDHGTICGTDRSSNVSITGGHLQYNYVRGGGSALRLDGSTTLTDADISWNYSSGSYKDNACVISCNTSSNITLSGNTVIASNFRQSYANNLYLVNGLTVTVKDPGKNMDIHVTTASTPSSPIAITGTGSADYSSCFTSDNGYLVGTLNPTDHIVYLLASGHVHTWTYSASGAAITAECVSTLGSCSGTTDTTLTLTAPADLTYSGSEKTAGFKESSLAGQTSLPSIEYYSGETKLDAAPVNVGTYTAKASVRSGDEAVTASTDFTITAKNASSSDITIGSINPVTYNGNEQTPDVTVKDGKTVLVKGTDYTVSYSDNKLAGTANVTLTFTGNYTGTRTTSFKIVPKEITVSGITAVSRAYEPDRTSVDLVTDAAVLNGKIDGDDLAVSAKGSMADADVNENKTVTISGLSLSGKDSGNYTLASTGNQETTTVTITKADQKAPSVEKSDETIKGKGDGRITGLDTSIEYLLPDAADYTAASTDTLENLVPGTYKIRAAENANYKASEAAEVSIGEGRTLTVTFDEQGGREVEDITGLSWQDTVTPPEDFKVNYSFLGWNTSASGSGDMLTSETQITDDITYYAIWSYNSRVYNVNISETENGTVTASPASSRCGAAVTLTVTPDEGYELDTLTVTNTAGKAYEVTKVNKTTYVFYMPADNALVQASFRKSGSDTPDYSSCPRDNTCVYAKYTDSSTTEWYHDGVHYCVQNGLMVGTSDITFEPNANLSRSMIVTILWRMEGSPEVNYAMSFEDVADGQWYTEAIRWAQSTGIVKGLSDTSFAPDDNVTREQLAAILMRYADYKGLDTSARADLSGYTDADSISDWAVENIQWANASGIINGRTETTIVPDGSATRAEAASMIQRFCETILK